MRYMARRILTGEWLTRDLTLTDVERTLTLSGPSIIAANVTPEFNRVLAPTDDLRIAEDWATMIYACNEDSGDIEQAGIVLPPTNYDDATRITCAGVTAYPSGYIYTGARLWGPQAAVAAKRNKNGKIISPAKPEIPRPDPIAIFIDHWDWIQNQPDSDLAVRITGDLSTAKVEADREAYAAATANEIVKGRLLADAQEDLKDAQKALKRVLADKNSTAAQKKNARDKVDEEKGDVKDAKDALAAVRATMRTYEEGRSLSLIGTYAEPYRLRKWDTPDLGSEIDTLAQFAPFEFVEEAQWLNAARTRVDHTVRVGYPRLGRQRDDLRFVLGENVVITPGVTTVEGGANHLIGLGKGEAGPSMVYEDMPWSDGRLRRTRLLTDKTATSAVMKRKLGRYREAFNQRYDVVQVAIIDHPNARLSRLQLGDDIRIQADHPEFGDIDLYVRILSITRGDSDESAVLTTSASVFFIYNPTEEVS